MALIFPNSQLTAGLQMLVNAEAPEDLRLHLYVNDFTPSPGEFSLVAVTEADFTGYSSELLSTTNWEASGATTALLQYDTDVVFESTASDQDQDVYGYYVTREGSNELFYAERFSDGPYHIANTGDRISIPPRITLTNSGS